MNCSRRWGARFRHGKPEKFGGLGPIILHGGLLRGAGAHQLWRRADGDRRADRHGDPGAGEVRQRRVARRVPEAFDQRRIRRVPGRFSEVGAGSDVASIRTVARSDGDDYGVINGGKMWTTNGAQADWMCLLANTGDGPAHRNKSLICLPMKSRRHRRADAEEDGHALVGHRADLLRGRARAQAQPYRPGGPSASTPDDPVPGGAHVCRAQRRRERTINDCIANTRERKIFGKSVLDNQVVH